jgi:acetyl-CoA carboxylase carboxyl transferase subunit alpha
VLSVFPVSPSSSAWQTVELARHPQRPYALDYIHRLAPDFIELHGDRCSGDDRALVAGLGTWNGMTTCFLGQQKGRELADRIARNFGMMHPEGYRKALRMTRLAAKFAFPIVSLVDTPGAFPGAGAEERGIAGAIATSIMEFFRVPVPLIAVVIGEGGSGGALGIGVADRVLILENAIYSVAMPEACASILWRDAAGKVDAAQQLGLTATRLFHLGLVDAIIPEPPGGAHLDHDAMAASLDLVLRREFALLARHPADELLERRAERFRRIGVEEGPAWDAS